MFFNVMILINEMDERKNVFKVMDFNLVLHLYLLIFLL